MQRYYAAYEAIPFEVAIFRSEKERDEWIRGEDWLSRSFPMDGFEKISLTQEEAYELIGDCLYDELTYKEDAILDNIIWAIGTPKFKGENIEMFEREVGEDEEY